MPGLRKGFCPCLRNDGPARSMNPYKFSGPASIVVDVATVDGFITRLTAYIQQSHWEHSL